MKRIFYSVVLAVPLALTGLAAAKQTHNAKLTMERACAIALDKVRGTVVHAEMEKERGRWIYSIEVRPSGERGKRIKEVNLDADTGAIVEIATEND